MFRELKEFLQPITLSIDQVFLDPNNPRLIDEDSELVPDDRITDDRIQARTLDNMRNQGLDELVDSMIQVGFLPIDRVVVRKVGGSNQFVVVEGNRRISALKIIIKAHENGDITLAEEILETMRSFDALEYTGDHTTIAWIIQGLRHISGIREWDAFQKGRFVFGLVEDEGKTLNEVGKILGVSASQAGIWFRAYAAYRSIKNQSEVGTRVTTKVFPYLQELFSRGCTSLREWLDWDDSERVFRQQLHVQEFVNWRFPDDEQKQAITQAIELRRISELRAETPHIFDKFRGGLSLDEAFTLKIEEEARERATRTQTLERYLNKIEEFIGHLSTVPIVEARRSKNDVLASFKRIIETLEEIQKSLD